MAPCAPFSRGFNGDDPHGLHVDVGSWLRVGATLQLEALFEWQDSGEDGGLMRMLGEETKLRTEHSVGTWASARESSQALDDSSTATRRRVLSKDCELYSRGHLNALVRYSQDAMNRSRHAARLALFDSLSQPATQAPITTTTVPPLTTAELRARRMSWIDRDLSPFGVQGSHSSVP